MSYADIPACMSCFPAVIVMPFSRVSFSEKWPTRGTFQDISSNGKFSDDGRPPPSDMRPGLLKYFAAALMEEGFRFALSSFRRSILCQTGAF